MRATMMDVPLTLANVLERAGTLFPETELVSRRPDRTVEHHTHREFHARAHALKSALLAAGLERGDPVATLMWNHAIHLEAYFGIPCAGGVVLTLNLRLHPSDLSYIAGHAKARFVVVDDVLLPLLKQINARFERTIVVNWNAGERAPGPEDYEAFIAGGGT